MHFALPPRKTSRPPPYAARNQGGISLPPALRNLLRSRLRLAVVGVLALITLLWLRGGSRGARGAVDLPKVAIGSGPPVVIVTVLDPKANPAWAQKIRTNREDYAKRHGYLTFFPTPTQYDLKRAPPTWSRVPALRHAMTLHPGSTFFWYLDSSALIMTPTLNLQTHLLDPTRLENLMITNTPVVPPDSVIKTFANIKGSRIDLIVTQDKEGLAPTSFVVRNGEWAKFFLDAWFDPIYRSYNFQKAETHALEHIVQWHGTMLAKLALVPQNTFNSYASGPASEHDGQFKEGDLVATFPGCDRDGRSCETEQQPYFERLERA
ncbi:glycosyltransferase family 34 protein [Dothidotthia symphoricarpi CBS 119687]|uniref:Glycosyltransferase family 34 protein n=1 Tax=Dothidotthia symphoricarpi CBS 119687 TaxID=1392245 RepID=A0A6A6AII1_9PLEO|nr:glycosyltransferase family 34 protein [Dothidotthia symphoricarpi CBS 119687]KAF2130714.1 glycosyltransferase family 34 protein [Dothidotthia symphoricarpi CBS 119687]